MSEATNEIHEKLQIAQAELDATLTERAAAERAMIATEQALAEQREALQVILGREGQLQGAVGDLKRALDMLTNE